MSVSIQHHVNYLLNLTSFRIKCFHIPVNCIKFNYTECMLIMQSLLNLILKLTVTLKLKYGYRINLNFQFNVQ